VSDKPDNQDQDQEPIDLGGGEFDLEPETESGPEQVWPPVQNGKGEPPGKPAEAPATPAKPGWPSEDEGLGRVEEIDQAIEEIRRINGEMKREPPIAATGAAPRQMVAGKVGLKREPPKAGSSSKLTRRVRPHADVEIGQLWGSVFFSSEIAPPRAIIVTAARRRDGATQVASSLSLVGAEASPELRIALVDFNLRFPAVADVFSIRNAPGLTEVLDGRATLEDALHRLDLPNGNQLFVLAAGASVSQPMGYLKSRQAQSLIASLKERFDHTIFDVATANQHPDPQVIGAQVDGALLVVRAGETPREPVSEAKKRLDLAGVRCLGGVLNQRSDPIPGFLYRRT